jgi:hypothetical protein
MFVHILTSLRIPFAIAIVVFLLAVSQSAGSVRAASLNVDQGDPSCSDVTGMPYCTIGAAVTDANASDTINVFPGTYAEQVHLNDMNTQGDITVIAVDASGTPTPGAVTVSPTTGAAFLADGPFPGSVTIDGFVVESPDADGILVVATGGVSIANVTANAVGDATDSGDFTGDDGVDVTSTAGDVAVTDCTANDNTGDYADGFDLKAYEGNVTVTNTTANNNTGTLDNDGIDIYDTSGDATVTGATANDNSETGVAIDGIGGVATITNSTANDNGGEGFLAVSVTSVSVDGVTAMGNGGDGMDIAGPAGLDAVVPYVAISALDNSSILNSHIEGNSVSGIGYLGILDEAGSHVADGSIICGNTDGGMWVNTYDDPPISAEGDWWGADSGPAHPVNNPSGSGDEIKDADNGANGTVGFDPWIDTISGSGGAATVGQPVVVAFEFSGGSGAVSLGDGPGDPNGSPPFSATADNGSVTTSGLIEDGKLEVTLTPETAGQATVTVTGPCGLDETTGGNSVVLQVAAAGAEAAPTPAPTATPVELPLTGGEPGSGGGAWTLAIVLLAAGVLALAGAGGALVAARRRR